MTRTLKLRKSGRSILSGYTGDFSTPHIFWISTILRMICFGAEALRTKWIARF